MSWLDGCQESFRLLDNLIHVGGRGGGGTEVGSTWVASGGIEKCGGN